MNIFSIYFPCLNITSFKVVDSLKTKYILHLVVKLKPSEVSLSHHTSFTSLKHSHHNLFHTHVKSMASLSLSNHHASVHTFITSLSQPCLPKRKRERKKRKYMPPYSANVTTRLDSSFPSSQTSTIFF